MITQAPAEGAAAVHAADPAAIQRGLARLALADGGAVTGLQRLAPDGAWESWGFDAGRVPLVLRRKVAGARDGSVSAATQARLIDSVARAGVQVPRVRLVLAPEHGLGEGLILDHVPGETRGERIVQDDRFIVARQALAYQCGTALARIHAIPSETLPPLRMAPAQAELAHLLALHRARGQQRAVFERAFAWLVRHAPPVPVSPALVHGDFRNGTLVVGEAGLRAVSHWELAHFGDPMEDLGWLCAAPWRFGRAALPVGGFGLREQLLAGYEAAGGRADAARMHYWEVMGTLRQAIGREPQADEREAEADLRALLTPRGLAAA